MLKEQAWHARVTTPRIIFPQFAERFNPCYAVKENFLLRNRKFNPQTLFVSILRLVSATNFDGYYSAMRRAWEDCGLKLDQAPSNSSLSEYREKVSYQFFEDLFNEDIQRSNPCRKTFRGYYLYAIDGDQHYLPASDDVLLNNFRGKKMKGLEETHYPKMYTVQAVDLIDGSTRAFECSTESGEVPLQQKIIPRLERNSITLYDRHFDSYATAEAHANGGSYFLVRVKSKNPKLYLGIKKFCESKKRSSWLEIPAPVLQRNSKPTILLRLVKIKNPRSNEDLVFMTNMPEGLIANKDIGTLYQKRWEIESAFKDLTDTLKMTQWHTTKINGIMQEIYTLLWLVNNVKRLCSHAAKASRTVLKKQYSKANFKHAVSVVLDNLDLLVSRKYGKLRRVLDFWIRRTLATREHLSRSYPRQVKRFGKQYTVASRVGLRPTAGA